MEKYRKKLQKSIGMLICFNSSFMVLGFALRRFVPKSENVFGHNFLSSVMVVLQFICIILIVRNGALLKNEEALKKAYTAHIDERNKSIRAKSLSASAVIILAGLSLALVAASVLNKTAALVLIGAILFGAVVVLITKLYYSKKM